MGAAAGIAAAIKSASHANLVSALAMVDAANRKRLSTALENTSHEELQQFSCSAWPIQTVTKLQDVKGENAVLLSGSPGDPLRGLSVHFWKLSFSKLMMVPEDSHKKVYDIEPQIRQLSKNFKCPRDGRSGSAYVDCAPDPDAGRANLMLSYSWGYEVRTIVRTLASYCETVGKVPREIRVWVCCVCINQHRVKEALGKGECVPFEEFQHAFGQQVRGIGHVLALVSPWSSPLYTSRVWCVYELYVASTNGIKLDFALPPEEQQDFERSFQQEGLQLVWNTLSKMQVQNAQASVATDRARILELIENGPGYAKLDKVVSERMQTWFLHAATERLNIMLSDTTVDKTDASQVASAGSQIIELNIRLGQINEAMAVGCRMTTYISATSAEATAGAGRCILWIGEGFFQQGQLSRANEEYKRALAALEAAGAGQSSDAATCIAFMGSVLLEQGQDEEAIVKYQEALALYEAAGCDCSSEAASCRISLGTAFRNQERRDEALGIYRQALAIFEAVGAHRSPDAASCIMSIATLLSDQEQYEEALVVYGKALGIYQAVGSGQGPDAAACIGSIACTLELQGRREDALAEYRKALLIYEDSGAGHNVDAAAYICEVAALLGNLDQREEALAEYRRAIAIYEALGHNDDAEWCREAMQDIPEMPMP